MTTQDLSRILFKLTISQCSSRMKELNVLSRTTHLLWAKSMRGEIKWVIKTIKSRRSLGFSAMRRSLKSGLWRELWAMERKMWIRICKGLCKRLKWRMKIREGHRLISEVGSLLSEEYIRLFHLMKSVLTMWRIFWSQINHISSIIDQLQPASIWAISNFSNLKVLSQMPVEWLRKRDRSGVGLTFLNLPGGLSSSREKWVEGRN